jgi:hypothetical protein
MATETSDFKVVGKRKLSMAALSKRSAEAGQTCYKALLGQCKRGAKCSMPHLPLCRNFPLGCDFLALNGRYGNPCESCADEDETLEVLPPHPKSKPKLTVDVPVVHDAKIVVQPLTHLPVQHAPPHGFYAPPHPMGMATEQVLGHPMSAEQFAFMQHQLWLMQQQMAAMNMSVFAHPPQEPKQLSVSERVHAQASVQQSRAPTPEPTPPRTPVPVEPEQKVPVVRPPMVSAQKSHHSKCQDCKKEANGYKRCQECHRKMMRETAPYMVLTCPCCKQRLKSHERHEDFAFKGKYYCESCWQCQCGEYKLNPHHEHCRSCFQHANSTCHCGKQKERPGVPLCQACFSAKLDRENAEKFGRCKCGTALRGEEYTQCYTCSQQCACGKAKKPWHELCQRCFSDHRH